MGQHPAQQLAAQAGEAAQGLLDFLSPLPGFDYPEFDDWTRDLTGRERAALLPQLLTELNSLGKCVEAMAGALEYEGTPRQHLQEAARLTSQACEEIRAAEKAFGSPASQPGTRTQPQLAAGDFPAATGHLPRGNPAASAPPPGTTAPAQRRAGSSPRPRNPRTR